MTVESVVIDPEAVDPEDVEMLQDMVCAAVNEAIRNINEQSNARLSAVTGGMGSAWNGRRYAWYSWS